mgnify:CR=1 FL=1
MRYSDDEINFYGCSREPRGDESLEAFFFNVTQLTDNDIWIPPGFDQNGCGTTITNPEGVGIRQGAVKDKLEEDSWSYKAGLDWFVTEDVMLYGSLSRGFKSGGFPNLPANVDTQYDPTLQEQLDAAEVGTKATLLDGTMQLNASAYYYKYEDKQLQGTILDPTFGVFRLLQNVPGSNVYGAEFDMQWQPLDGLYLSLGGSYVDSEVEEYTGPNAYGKILVFDVSPFLFTSKYQANALVNYEWPITGNLNTFVGADASYSDDINTDYEPESGSIDPDFVMDSYTVVGARLGIAEPTGKWGVMVWGRNLTDEEYTNNVQKTLDAVVQFSGMPRTYGVTVNYAYF